MIVWVEFLQLIILACLSSEYIDVFVWARLVNYNCNYIGIGIGITRNTICCNVILITIHLFGNNTIIESQKQWNESILNHT